MEKKQVVIKSFNGIGDLLFLTPTLRCIKEAYQDEVEVTVNTNFPALLEGSPYVDHIGTRNTGTFLGYPDPIHRAWPTRHHIESDFYIVRGAFQLHRMRPPLLKPEIWLPIDAQSKTDTVGVQVLHKGHWHKKKVWPAFNKLSKFPGLEPIPKVGSIYELVQKIASYRAVVCAEGGISHIAKAVGTPAIVIYGGFASPAWNGYEDQINITREKWCSYCYNPAPCKCEIERECMKSITVREVLRAVEGLRKIPELENHNAMKFVLKDALLWCRGDGVDVGAGRNPFPGARPIDTGTDENAYKINEKTGSLDYVFSSHCIEHLELPELALTEWARVLKPGGILYIYFPSPDYIPWRKSSMPKWHKHDLNIEEVCRLIRGCEILEISRKDWYFGQKIIARRVP